jgi:RNA polymerase sigma factor (sigma-70 family)
LFNFHNIKELSDNELVERYKVKDDANSVGILFERYTHFVFCVCMKYLKDEERSKDSAMQVFEKLMVDLKKHEIKEFKPWLHAVVKNNCLMILRQDKTLRGKLLDEKKDSVYIMEFEADPHHNINHQELKLQQLEKAVENLIEEQKICIDLFYVQEKSYKEVMDITGYSMNQVKSFIQNGRRNLKMFLLENKEIQLFILLLVLKISI